jgi:thioredoxin reductase (NADPH)
VSVFACPHLTRAAGRAAGVEPRTEGCEECLQTGDEWVHLRLCLSCGHVGCCDDSPNRHATRHFHASLHPVIRSYEPQEAWAYCYSDSTLAEQLPFLGREEAKVHYNPPGLSAHP